MSSSYRDLEALLHDAFWSAEESPEAEWLDALLSRHPGRSLEVGCGSGRLLLPLLRAGHQVEGLEPSADMLALCREAAADLHLRPVLHQGSMADFAPPHRYASILIPAFTLQLSPDPAADLQRLAALLEPGGLLYLTVFLPFAELDGELPENEWYPDHRMALPDGRRASVDTRHRIDRAAQRLHREHHYRLVDGETTHEHRSEQTVRWFDAVQLHRLITDAGLEPESAVADFDEELPVDDEAQIITAIARRPA